MSTVVRFIRWSAVVPSSVGGVLLVDLALHLLLGPEFADTKLLGVGILAGPAWVGAATAVAPSHKRETAVALGGAAIFVGLAALVLSCKAGDWRNAWGAVVISASSASAVWAHWKVAKSAESLGGGFGWHLQRALASQYALLLRWAFAVGVAAGFSGLVQVLHTVRAPAGLQASVPPEPTSLLGLLLMVPAGLWVGGAFVAIAVNLAPRHDGREVGLHGAAVLAFVAILVAVSVAFTGGFRRDWEALLLSVFMILGAVGVVWSDWDSLER